MPSSPTPDEPSTPSSGFDSDLRAAMEGSAEAVGRLLNGYRSTLLQLAEVLVDSQLRPKAGASDIVQETLVDAERSFRSFRGQSSSSLEAWLKQVLANNVLDEFRKWRSTQKRQLSREVCWEQAGISETLEDGGASPSSLVANGELETQLHEAIKRLSPDHEAVIRMRHFDGLEFAEIGRRLDRSEDAARKLWYRAFDKLTRFLEVSHDANRR